MQYGIVTAGLIMLALLTGPGCNGSSNAAGAPGGGAPPGGGPPAGGGPLTLTAVMPNQGTLIGGTPIVLTGTGFQGGGPSTVTIGGEPADQVVTVDDTMITALVPTSPAAVIALRAQVGPADVKVSNANGDATLPGGFTYTPFDLEVLVSEARIDDDPPGTGEARSQWQLCCDGDRVYAVWSDNRDMVQFADVFFSASSDGGQTWSADFRLSDSGRGSAAEICCDGENVYVAWEDTAGPRNAQFRRSLDGSQTWSDAFQLNAADATGAFPQLCCDGATVYAVWGGVANDQPGVFFARSTDGGETWTIPELIATSDNVGSLDFCCEGSNLYVSWLTENAFEGDDVLFIRSTDGGSSWSDPVQIDSESGAAEASSTALCCAGPNIYLAWVDTRNGDDHIFFNRSNDGGATWQAADTRIDGGAVDASSPSIACCDDDVYVSWDDDRTGRGEIYFQVSLDGGATFLENPRQVSTDQTSTFARSPAVCCLGQLIYLAWIDNRPGLGRFAMLASASADKGVTWLPELVLSNAGPVSFPVVCCDGRHLHIMWIDSRNGSSDFLLSRLAPP